MAKRCPACQGDVPEDALDCPNCPMSFRETEGPRRRRSHPAGLPTTLLLLGLAAALGYGGWQALVMVMERADSPESSFSIKSLSDGPAAKPAVPEQGGRRPAGSYKLKREEDEAPAGSVDSSPPDLAEPSVSVWVLRGVVYDLDSLGPVPGASLTFIDAKTDRRLRTVTDGMGRYRARVPPLHLGGYTVKIVKDGYAADYLSPSIEGVARMPREQRRRLGRGLAASLSGPQELPPADSEDGTLKTDFYLAPLLP